MHTRGTRWLAGLLGAGLLVGAGCDQLDPWSQQAGQGVAGVEAPATVGTSPETVEAPAWTLRDLEGHTRTLQEFRGQVVLLNFWATWCPPCREEIPDLVRVQDKFHARGFTIVGISLDESGVEAVRSFADGYHMTYPIVLGTIATARQYRVSGVPASFLIDREGRIVKRWSGPYPEAAFAARIEEALAQETQ